MCLIRYADEPDPEPEDPAPARPLCVPARPGGAHRVLRLFRTPLGARTAVGFTGPDRLAATLGAAQPWIRLSEAALRSMTAPLGASLITVDPTLTAPPAAPAPDARPPAPAPAPRPPVRQAAGATARSASEGSQTRDRT
ncbi:SAV_915 family protein [Streptomyces sp. NPDC006529]|uniref:SAV_915 family protein n=1 Tax=Streptomyces sp. NPDC006529 TaxID=3157177 RepID=UPI0033AFA72F